MRVYNGHAGGTPRTRTYTITQVLDQVLNLQVPDFDLGIEPFGEGLLLDSNPVLLLSKGHLGWSCSCGGAIAARAA